MNFGDWTPVMILIYLILFGLFQTKQLALVGGTDPKNATRRIFWKAMTAELGSQYSYLGRVSKKNTQRKKIEGTRLCDAIKKSAVASSVQTPGIEQIVEDTLKACLKHVSDKMSERSHKKDVSL